jgi:fructose-1,6-bisphosphatase/sedoheptulose 1,7-bisphosphatase-like protein
MHTAMTSRRLPTTAEDGETIGTLAQFASALHVPPAALLRCAERHDQAIVLSSDEGAHIVLILDADSQASLPRCARSLQT